MKITVSPEKGKKQIQLSVRGQRETYVSEISHEEIKHFATDHDQIEDFDFDLGDNGEVLELVLSIPNIISLEIENGSISNFELNIPNIEVSQAPFENNTHEPDPIPNDSSKATEPVELQSDVPPVPSIDIDSMPEDYVKRYNSMQNVDTQPYEIRRIIYSAGEITRRNLKHELQKLGYDVEPGKQHTGVSSTLRVLDEYTNEIQRDGRGEDKTLKWIGKSLL